MRKILALAAAAALVTALANAVPASADTGPSYVALGDSYAAGVGIPTQYAGACQRSTQNYPHLVAAATGYALADETCGGATTDTVTATQLGDLSHATKLVTLTIGGNNLGLVDIGTTCVLGHLADLLAWAPCQNALGSQIQDGIDLAAGKVAALIQQIHAEAPSAEVVLVGYPRILPDNAWACQFNEPPAVGDVDYVRNAELSLNAMLATQAQANRATYVDTYHATDGHDICRPNADRWMEGLVVVNGSGEPFHPNQYGQVAMAAAVLPALS